MSVPYWRYIRYTDDGCALQCLHCYNQWESRTEPGWMDRCESFSHPVEGHTCSYTTTRGDGVQVPHYVRLRAEPIYRRVWRYCPHCGIMWEGPIRTDDDNERMHGPKRKQIELMVCERRSADGWRHPEPDFWWVIQERTVWPDREEQATWKSVEFFKGFLMPTPKVLYLLREHKRNLKKDSLFGEYEEARIVIKHERPKTGYEVGNYDWNYDE